MFKISTAIVLTVLISFFYGCIASADGGNSLYQKMMVKKRAERYAETGGLSSSGRDLYIYADDDDISNSLNDIKENSHSIREQDVKIFSPSIEKRSKVKNVNVVVEAKRGIIINRSLLGIKNNEISIANPVIEKGSKVQNVNILVDAKQGGIEVK